MLRYFKMSHNLTNQKFSRLLVIKDTGLRDHGSVVWKCKCDCGNVIQARSDTLLSGRVVSCGCATKERGKKRIKEIRKIREKSYIENTDLSLITSAKLYKNNTSGCKGVSYRKDINMWQARITFQKKVIRLGCFKDKEKAVEARREAEEKYFKTFLDNLEARTGHKSGNKGSDQPLKGECEMKKIFY